MKNIQSKTYQIISKKSFVFLAILLTLIIILFFSPKNPDQFTEISPMQYWCNWGSLYMFDFTISDWAMHYCSVPEIPGCGEWNPPGYCSRPWSFKHPMGQEASLICASQVCKKINGVYQCKGGYSLDQLIEAAKNNDNTGWIARECFTKEEILSKESCVAAGGFISGDSCAQLDAVRNWAINNEVDCIKAGGLWSETVLGCWIPQDLLIEIDPGNPDANCGGVEGEEACAVLRWLLREDESILFMSTMSVGHRHR